LPYRNQAFPLECASSVSKPLLPSSTTKNWVYCNNNIRGNKCRIMAIGTYCHDMTFVTKRSESTHGNRLLPQKSKMWQENKLLQRQCDKLPHFFAWQHALVATNLVHGDSLMQHASTSWQLADCGDRHSWR
jgi:hypothetical protein